MKERGHGRNTLVFGGDGVAMSGDTWRLSSSGEIGISLSALAAYS